MLLNKTLLFRHKIIFFSLLSCLRWFCTSSVSSRGVIVWLNWKRKSLQFRRTVKLRLSPVMNFALIRILQMEGCHRNSDGTLLICGGSNRSKLNEGAMYCFRCCATTRSLLSARLGLVAPSTQSGYPQLIHLLFPQFFAEAITSRMNTQSEK